MRGGRAKRPRRDAQTKAAAHEVDDAKAAADAEARKAEHASRCWQHLERRGHDVRAV